MIPDCVNPSPDYYCTWQSQLYRCSNSGTSAMRESMTEENIFGTGDEELDCQQGKGWASHQYKDARKDLLFVLDDSWDVPIGDANYGSPWFGSQILAQNRFPSFFENGANDKERNICSMAELRKAIEDLGWKGIGGWICCQKDGFSSNIADEDYWAERLQWAESAGWKYWKVDWGSDCHNFEIRRKISQLKFTYAPDMIVEHAIVNEVIPYADVYRTYDAISVLSIAITMDRLSTCLRYNAEPNSIGLINCEDEVYISAALGCTFGAMRHNMTDNLPNGDYDCAFPSVFARNVKTKIDEVTRAARWHRIAPAFSVNRDVTFIDDNLLTDTYDVVHREREIEEFWNYKDGDHIEVSAPARISRNVPPPEVKADKNDNIPFVVSALNPMGVASIAALGRTINRDYIFPMCDIVQDVKGATKIGVFGFYGSLTLISTAIKKDSKVLIQDILSEEAFDITDLCIIHGNHIKIPGDLINSIGVSKNHEGDTSEPGVVIGIVT